MTIDPHTIEVGDTVVITAKVTKVETADYDGNLTVEIEDGAGGGTWINHSIITAHMVQPRALRSGDRVRDLNGSLATVIFADETDIVVRMDAGGIHFGPTEEFGRALERLPKSGAPQ